jgi:cell division protein FtsI/penicillin-binding protein 2
MNAARLEAASVVQDVSTGTLVALAASQPSKLDVTTQVLPLSLAKLLLAASWWDHGQPDARFECYRAGNAQPAKTEQMTVHDMLVTGCDLPGKQMAVALRRALGTTAVLRDLKRFGFGPRTKSSIDETFWLELDPTWRTRLIPAPAYNSLTAGLNDKEWQDALSLGETHIMVTLLHVSRFLQAVGNSGTMLPPVAVSEQATELMQNSRAPQRLRGNALGIMQESTALRLQAAMREVVQRGSATTITRSLQGTGWQIGGKTGTGPGTVGPESDGWFAGLIFDPQGKARFTVATFVRHGGPGRGNAANISAELARYIIGESTAASH